MQVTDDIIRNVVAEVMANLQHRQAAPTNGKSRHWGVYDDVNEAVAGARDAQLRFATLGLAQRKQAVDCIRKICIERAEELGKAEFEETKIGRLAHKVERLIGCAERT